MSDELLEMITALTHRVNKLEKLVQARSGDKNNTKKASSQEVALYQMVICNGVTSRSMREAGADVTHLSQVVYALRHAYDLDITLTKEVVQGRSVGVYQLKDKSKNSALELLNQWRQKRGDIPLKI